MLCYRELTGRDADYVEIYNLDEGKRRPRSVEEDMIEDVRAYVGRAATALRENSFEAVARRSACEKCDYLGLWSKGQATLKDG